MMTLIRATRIPLVLGTSSTHVGISRSVRHARWSTPWSVSCAQGTRSRFVSSSSSTMRGRPEGVAEMIYSNEIIEVSGSRSVLDVFFMQFF